MNTVHGLIFVKFKLKRQFYKCNDVKSIGRVGTYQKLQNFFGCLHQASRSLWAEEKPSLYIYIHLWYLSVLSNFTYRAHFVIIGDNNNNNKRNEVQSQYRKQW